MSAKLKAVPSQSEPVTVLLVEQPNLMWEFRGRTFEQHVECWQELSSEIERDSWMLGAIAASLVSKYNESTVDRFAHEVRLSGRRVREIAQTYRAFQNGERSPILSFHHHTLAARGPEHNIDPVEAIHKAEDNEWSTRELKSYVETGIEPEPKPPKRTEPKDPNVALEMAKLHDEAVQKQLADRLGVMKEWPDTAITPLLAAVYRRLGSIIEWQKNRTVERDCLAVMEVFSNEEGYTAPDCASFSYIQAWLSRRGWFMTKKELQDRMGTLKTLHMLTDNSRKGSKGATQRGVVTPVYDPCLDYAVKMEEFSTMNPTDRRIAVHLDWVQRVKKYAPDLLPKAKAA